MNLPGPEDYIDIHDHEGKPGQGVFRVENLMAHEDSVPDATEQTAYTYGIHPWHLSAETVDLQIGRVRTYASHGNVLAVGEAGFDRLRGPDKEIQRRAFEEQVAIAAGISKPVFIHCVRAWDDLLASHRRMKPATPWLIHGFRGKRDLAEQLIAKGMYISFWFDFILRQESSALIRSLPVEKIFLETDGSGMDIKTIYEKVANDLEMEVGRLKKQIIKNFNIFFRL